MDKELIVLGFLLLCIFLSLKKEEGFATINVSEFETACNADGSTCEITISGSSGYLCEENTDSNLYTITTREGAERDLHSDSFNLETNRCSDAGYETGISISVLPCTHSGGRYNLTGCSANCVPPVSDLNDLDGYSATDGTSQIPYITPGGEATVAPDGIECSDGYIPAQDVCYDEHGNLTRATSESGCRPPHIWYNQGDPIQILCNEQGDGHYKYIGCMPGCLPRNGSTEYTTDTDLDNLDREIIQILNRPNPGTDTTNLMTLDSGSSPYNMVEDTDSLNPTAFSVSGSPQDVQFDGSTTVSFGGDVTPSACPINSQVDGIDTRKYSVEGLYPTCDSSDGREYECLNFNIAYDNIPSNKLNIEDFKSTMADSAAELGISGDTDISSYQNSLYYYRRYKDTDGKVHVEGQIRCDNDENSPFHCVVSNNQGVREVLDTYFYFGVPEGEDNIYSTEKRFDPAESDVGPTDGYNAAAWSAGFVGCNTSSDCAEERTLSGFEGSEYPRPPYQYKLVDPAYNSIYRFQAIDRTPDTGFPTGTDSQFQERVKGSYLVQKNAFCFGAAAQPEGIEIDWNGNNIDNNIVSAIERCDNSENCVYITQKEEDGNSKFYSHTSTSDHDSVPRGIIPHPDFNCIFKPDSSDPWPGAVDIWRGAFLMEPEDFPTGTDVNGGTEPIPDDYTGYKDAKCLAAGNMAVEVGRCTAQWCNDSRYCVGFDRNHQSGKKTCIGSSQHFWTGQMVTPRRSTYADRTNTDCFIKKRPAEDAQDGFIFQQNFTGLRPGFGTENQVWTDQNFEDRNTYTLKTKEEIERWFRRSS